MISTTESQSYPMKRFSTYFTRLGGWRGTLKLLCALSWLMLSVNIVVSLILTFMSKHQNQDRKSSSVVMMNTSCKKVSQMDTSVHLLMNIFSAALLGATNFAMQAWAAPTRADVDQIHKSGGTADIGIISMTNMFHIRPKRLIMWTIMLVKALPLHLVYNSAISSTTSRPVYNVVVVSPEYLTRPFRVSRDSIVSELVYQQTHDNMTHGLLFDLQDTSQWREVDVVASAKIDLRTKASSYGGVVLVAYQKSTRATRNKTSEPASGILYHRIEKASLSSDLGADWMTEISILWDEETPEGPGWQTVEHKESIADTEDHMQVDMQGFFWGQLCRFGLPTPLTPDDAHCYIDDYLAITDRSGPSTPVFRIRGKIFVRRVDPKCRLLAEPVFWWLTTFCNLVIAACLSSMAWFYRSAPLVTIGDAIDSFITEPPSPDSKTIPRSSCTYHHPSFTNIFRPALPPRTYKPQTTPLWKSVSLTRWSLTMAWFIGMLSQCIQLISNALSAEYDPDQRLASLSTFNPNNSLDSKHILFPSNGSDVDMIPRRWRLVLLANTPQIFLSLTYLFFNNILTKMVAEREWHSFGFHVGTQTGTSETSAKKKRTCRTTWWRRKEEPQTAGTSPKRTKTLRTSQPRGSQRSTFFLSLPYRYALPFVAVSSVMHWLTSQCLYFTEVDFIDLDGTTLDKSNPTTITLGYSICAMLWVIVLGTLSWVTILGLAVFGKYPAGMPIMGGCSAVIAAACHVHAPLMRKGVRREREGGDGDGDGDGDEEEEEGGTDIAAGPLSWGVIRQVVVRDGVEVEEKWLGFTKGEAESPVVGEVYG